MPCFDEHKVSALLTDVSPKESSYYKAILQNLFFATLNQEMGQARVSPERPELHGS